MVFTFLASFLASAPPRSQKEFSQPSRQRFFENLFPLTAERGRGNYDLFYQNLIRKYKIYLEH